MKEQVNRIAWLERQLAQVKTFIERDTALLKEDPNDFSVELSLNSWKYEHESLEGELRLAKKELSPNSLEIFFAQDDGFSTSKKDLNDAFTYFFDEMIKAISLAAAFRINGRGPNKGRSYLLDKNLLFSYKQKENESHTMVLSEKTKEQSSHERSFEHAILGILKTLNSESHNKLFENFLTIGLDCAIQLQGMLAALDQRGFRPRLAWASKDHVLFWHGDEQHSIKSFERLSLAKHVKTRSMLLTGAIMSRDDNGVFIRPQNHSDQIKIFCSDVQRTMISNTKKDKVISIEIMEYDLYIGEEIGRLTAFHAIT